MQPGWVKMYYGVSSRLAGSDPKNTQGIGALNLGSSSNGYYSPSDLKKFYKQFNIPDANINQVKFMGVNNASVPDIETELDIQWLTGMGAGVKTLIFHGDVYSDSQIDSILERIQNSSRIPYVISFSYGGSEAGFAAVPNAIKHINEALQILGTMGVTVLVSSGDNGAYGTSGICSQGFTPMFLASSPYVLAVGATQLQYQKGGVMGSCPSEIVASTATGSLITSGGGFSEIFPRPTYQNNVLSNYFKNNPALPASAIRKRGYPDVCFLGHNFNIIDGGLIRNVDGTSASSPSLAGLLSLANDYRLENGLRPFGFINPLLYQIYAKNSKAFRDITQGTNNCVTKGVCCEKGYKATIGWDPTSGLGSIDFKAAWVDLTSFSSNKRSKLPPPSFFSTQNCEVSDMMPTAPGNQGFPTSSSSSALLKFFSNPIVIVSLIVAAIVGLFMCGRIICCPYFKSNNHAPLLKNINHASYNTI